MSDNDFYQRKAQRLEADLADIAKELASVRSRLRAAEDDQIKYQLLLRQSEHQNLRLQQLEEKERERFSYLLEEELGKAERIWTTRMEEFEQTLLDQEAEEKEQLRKEMAGLRKKIQQLTAKGQQADALLFQNKKIARDLQALEEIIEENKLLNERNKEQEIKACRDTLAQKNEARAQKERQQYQDQIQQLQAQLDILSEELVREAAKTQRMAQREQSQLRNNGPSVVPGQLEKFRAALENKDQQMEAILEVKLKFEQQILAQKQELNGFIKELEDKIFNMEKAQEIELFNLKARTENIHHQQLEELNKKNQILLKEKLQQSQHRIKGMTQEINDLLETNEKLEKDISKLSADKDRMSEKIMELKARLREHQNERELGETQQLIQSFKNAQGREDQTSSYENGINFLEKQLRRAAIKIDKKNDEVQQLITDLTRVRNECQQEVADLKDKNYADSQEYESRVRSLESEVRTLNQEVRKRQKERKQAQNEANKTISQLRVELRSLKNLNSDLQRDYNRILESKKAIQKSFREERERSVTSKSQIALSKKQKWLQLERQKHDIEIIYKQKQQQLRNDLTAEAEELRVQRDQLRRDNQLLKQQLAKKPPQISENDKQNAYSEYHKKLATINLEIALTENLYSTLVQAKSRRKIPQERQKSQIQEAAGQSVHSSAKFMGSELLDDLGPASSNDLNELKKQLEGRTSEVQGQGMQRMYESFNPNFQQ